MKKIIALILAVVFIVAAFCGCGGATGGNGKTELVWAKGGTNQKDHDMVLEKVNELLAEKMPNTTLTIKQDSSFGTKWSLWMAGKIPIDIAFSGYFNDLAGEINKKSYLPLNDLIDKYAPTIKAESEKYPTHYATGMMEGEIYAIPNIQIHVNDSVYFGVPAKYYEHFDTEAFVKLIKTNPTTTEAFYQIIDKYLTTIKPMIEKEGLQPYIYGVQHVFRNMVKRGYEFVGGNNSLLCYKLSDDSCKIVNFYDTEEYNTYIKYASKWYKEGFINKDILTDDNELGGNFISVFTANIQNFRIADEDKNNIIDSEEDKKIAGDGKLYKINMTPEDQKYNGSAVIGSLKTYCSIPMTSKNPEKAMQLLELLRTEEGFEILNTLVYGIEGTHYEKTSDTEIKAFDYLGQSTSSSKYGMHNWIMGNMFNMYVCYPYTIDTKNAADDYFNKEMPKFKKTKLCGYTFDNMNIATELSQMEIVNEEYNLQMIGGTTGDNYMQTYAEMQKKLEAAGIKNVIAEYQKQADAFIKK